MTGKAKVCESPGLSARGRRGSGRGSWCGCDDWRQRAFPAAGVAGAGMLAGGVSGVGATAAGVVGGTVGAGGTASGLVLVPRSSRQGLIPEPRQVAAAGAGAVIPVVE